ncbi:MAG: hypothetical protein ABH879_07950 [archaeon]
MKIQLFVSLKIPDTTAITAYQTVRRMGYDKIANIKRYDNYVFDVAGSGGEIEKQLAKTDILVNSNKHNAAFLLEAEDNCIRLLVTERKANFQGILTVLRDRLGFRQIRSLARGTVWCLYFEGDLNKGIAQEIGDKLLYNRHYQEIRGIS